MKLEPPQHPGAAYEVNVYGVNPGYFDTFGARILVGRDFDASDAPKSSRSISSASI